MLNSKTTVLVVDDEELNLELIADYLSDDNIESVCVESGEQALERLHENPNKFSAVLLDRMMPGLNGIEVLQQIKADEKLNEIPVIMQTAKVGTESMIEGLKAGAQYYLSKPYDQQTLSTIVSTAIHDYKRYAQLQDDLKQAEKTLMMMEKGEFTFKSLDEGRDLATLLAQACPDSSRVILGLTELLINAVEHGNLAIDYDETSKLQAVGELENVIDSRLISPLYKDKIVTLEFSRSDDEINFTISDQGAGFDWSQYMEICPERAFDTHGRGIALANSISFDRLEYSGSGSKVCATVSLH